SSSSMLIVRSPESTSVVMSMESLTPPPPGAPGPPSSYVSVTVSGAGGLLSSLLEPLARKCGAIGGEAGLRNAMSSGANSRFAVSHGGVTVNVKVPPVALTTAASSSTSNATTVTSSWLAHGPEHGADPAEPVQYDTSAISAP